MATKTTKKATTGGTKSTPKKAIKPEEVIEDSKVLVMKTRSYHELTAVTLIAQKEGFRVYDKARTASGTVAIYCTDSESKRLQETMDSVLAEVKKAADKALTSALHKVYPDLPKDLAQRSVVVSSIKHYSDLDERASAGTLDNSSKTQLEQYLGAE